MRNNLFWMLHNTPLLLLFVFSLTTDLFFCCRGFVSPPVHVAPPRSRGSNNNNKNKDDDYNILLLLLSTRAKRLFLVPIRNFRNEFTFLSQSDDYYRGGCIDSDGNYYYHSDDDDERNGDNSSSSSSTTCYQLGLAEERDLPDTSRFIVQAFGVDAIRLSQDITTFEKFLMKPAVELVNGYSGIVAFAEVLAGLRSRLAGRLYSKNNMNMAPPALPGPSRQDKINQSVGQALVLILAKPHQGSDWHVDVIATIELRLQPCDAKIPFSLPWLDRIERKLASWIGIESSSSSRDLQPYLSNLAVDEAYRGKGLGRALVRCVEDIAASRWGYSKMYLHVAEDNPSALQLYKSEGYRDVGLRWKPFWAGSGKLFEIACPAWQSGNTSHKRNVLFEKPASDIGYYVKKLNERKHKESDKRASDDEKVTVKESKS